MSAHHQSSFHIVKPCSALLALALSLQAASPALAQSAPQGAQAPPDLVKMKNGGMLRGTIVELVPGQFVQIQLATGERRKIRMREVDYAGPAASAPGAAPPAAPEPPPAPEPPSPPPPSPPPSPPPAEPPRPAPEAPKNEGPRPLVTIQAPEADIQFQAEAVDVTLHLQTHEAAVVSGRMAHVRGYERICTAPCNARMASGTYRFALSWGGYSPVEVPESISISGPSKLTARWESHAAERKKGYIISWVGIGVGGALAIAGLYEMTDTSADKGTPLALLFGGASAVFLGLLIGGSFITPDTPHITVTPMAPPTALKLPGEQPLAAAQPRWEDAAPRGLSMTAIF